MPLLKSLSGSLVVFLVFLAAPGIAQEGLFVVNQHLISQDTAGIADLDETGDGFGSAVAAGDFNGDGFDDLAVSSPYKSFLDVAVLKTEAGKIDVIPGGPGGLDPANSIRLVQGQTEGTAQDGDHFGSALATGDFNDDGFDDLVIAAVDEDVFTAIDAGNFIVVYGSENGLDPMTSVLFNRNTDPSLGGAASGDAFGKSLSVGFFNDDVYADLAIGAPNAEAVEAAGAGVVAVLFGSETGLLATAQLLDQSDFSAATPEAGDGFGAALAKGNWNGVAPEDLFIGIPGRDESMPTVQDVGIVIAVPGGAGDLSTAGHQVLDLDPGVLGNKLGSSVVSANVDSTGTAELFAGRPGASNTGGISTFGSVAFEENGAATGEAFGFALAAGDVDGDGFPDVIVGAPGASVASGTRAGRVEVLFGSGPADFSRRQDLDRSLPSVSGQAAQDDSMGAALCTGDFDGDGYADLAVGVPQRPADSPSANPGGGQVLVFFGALYGAGFETGDTSEFSLVEAP